MTPKELEEKHFSILNQYVLQSAMVFATLSSIQKGVRWVFPIRSFLVSIACMISKNYLIKKWEIAELNICSGQQSVHTIQKWYEIKTKRDKHISSLQAHTKRYILRAIFELCLSSMLLIIAGAMVQWVQLY